MGYKIQSRTTHAVSPWVNLVEKHVLLPECEEPQVYHFLKQSEYVGIIAITEDGRIPIVRQYRPCVEDFTWEFPAGTIDGDETPEASARRELLEESGFEAGVMEPLGPFFPDTGRLAFESHGFFADKVKIVESFIPEEGIEVRLVTLETLKQMCLSGEFKHQLHLALISMAFLKGFLNL